MKKSVILSVAVLIAFVFAVGFVDALEVKKTPITVQAGMYNDLSVSILDGDNILQTFTDYANEHGIYEFEYIGLIAEFGVRVEAKTLHGDEIGSEDFGPFTAGDAVTVTFETGEPEIAEDEANEPSEGEETAEDEEETSDETTTEEIQDTIGITGNVVGDSAIELDPMYYYIGGAVLVVGLVMFLVTRRKRSGLPPHELKKVKEKSEKGGLKPWKPEAVDKEIESAITEKSPDLLDAEKKIKDLEKELKAVKNRGKVEELEKHIMDERAEIKKLMKGEE